MTPAIRTASTKDLHDLLALERSIPELPHWPRTEYERYVAMPVTALDRVLLVATEAEVIVGFAAAALNLSLVRTAELESIAVTPRMRRSGIGRELCQCVMAWCRACNAETLELEVRSKSVGAIALYRSLGFDEVRTRSWYYGNPADDALLMALTL